MIVLGLTGSIGMGKTTVANIFAEEGASVFDSDAAVHALYAKGGAAAAPIGQAFPNAVRDGAVDRAALSRALADDPAAFARLEALVHPLVQQAKQRFLDRQRAAGEAVVVLDIPLLFETGAEKSVDRVVVVTAPLDVQRARVMARPGMTEEKFAALLARQLPDAEKRVRADFVIDNGGSLDATRAQVRGVLDAVREAV